ncbi:gp52 [Lysinibacillus capsici]|uniref:Gp52 n=1 Tax=Lysinibacillus capsici TaxID=2115968 RepID=A0A2X0Y7E7_9BACI|nr:YopX family protein [Lysinibacillus capsici]SPT98380.1 gp52 [Lysinibacillus capsici]
MSREIKFRAKVADSDYENEKQSEMIGSFVHFTGFIGLENDIGYVEQLEEIHGVGWFDVDIKTLGQYTGLKDKDGTDIFEGDIVQFKSIRDIIERYEVEYTNYGEWAIGMHRLSMRFRSCEVIGNVHEHSHLLEETE